MSETWYEQGRKIAAIVYEHDDFAAHRFAQEYAEKMESSEDIGDYLKALGQSLGIDEVEIQRATKRMQSFMKRKRGQ